MPEYTYLDIRLETGGVDQEEHEQARQRIRAADKYIFSLLRLMRIASYGARHMDGLDSKTQRNTVEFLGEDVFTLAELIESFVVAVADDVDYLAGIRWEFDEPKKAKSRKKEVGTYKSQNREDSR